MALIKNKDTNFVTHSSCFLVLVLKVGDSLKNNITINHLVQSIASKILSAVFLLVLNNFSTRVLKTSYITLDVFHIFNTIRQYILSIFCYRPDMCLL